MTTPEQLQILQHSLGVDRHGQGSMYRDHYAVGPGCDSWDDCQRLVRLGLMVDHGPQRPLGSLHYFRVTAAGKAHVREASPPPPRRTRSQLRYEHWLRVADAVGMTFGQFIKSPMSKGTR